MLAVVFILDFHDINTGKLSNYARAILLSLIALPIPAAKSGLRLLPCPLQYSCFIYYHKSRKV